MSELWLISSSCSQMQWARGKRQHHWVQGGKGQHVDLGRGKEASIYVLGPL